MTGAQNSGRVPQMRGDEWLVLERAPHVVRLLGWSESKLINLPELTDLEERVIVGRRKVDPVNVAQTGRAVTHRRIIGHQHFVLELAYNYKLA